jgi:hypothetical protein
MSAVEHTTGCLAFRNARQTHSIPQHSSPLYPRKKESNSASNISRHNVTANSSIYQQCSVEHKTVLDRQGNAQE